MVERGMLSTLADERRFQVEIYEDFEDIAISQSEWDAFMESVDAEIFLTFDWCRSWWKFYGKKRKLKIFIFRERKNICGTGIYFCEMGPFAEDSAVYRLRRMRGISKKRGRFQGDIP